METYTYGIRTLEIGPKPLSKLIFQQLPTVYMNDLAPRSVLGYVIWGGHYYALFDIDGKLYRGPFAPGSASDFKDYDQIFLVR